MVLRIADDDRRCILAIYQIVQSACLYGQNQLLTNDRKSAWPFEAGTPCGNVLPQITGTRTIDEAGSARNHGGAEASRRRCGHGIKSSLHGHEGGSEDRGYNHYELHVGVHAVECEDEG